MKIRSMNAPLLAILGMLYASPALAQPFPIAFDATALDAARFNVDFNAVGGTDYDANAVITLQIEPGNHTFCAPASADCFQFSVLADGTLAFAPELAAYVAGRNTTKLIVTGLPVNFDATRLDASRFNLNFNGVGGTDFPNTVTTFRVLPGLYTFCAPASADCVQFSVVNDGTLQYAVALDAFVGGRGTDTLTAVGFPITIDATARGGVRFNLNFNAVGGTDFPNAVTTFQVPTTRLSATLRR